MKKLIIAAVFLLVLSLTVSAGLRPGFAEAGTGAPDADPGQITEKETAMNPTFVIEMENGGKMSGELYPDIAPESVGNFIELANSGFYDGLIFHRVIPGFMIQGGDPLGNGTGGPGYCIKGEFRQNGVENSLRHTEGVLSMARSRMPDSAGSQFFIMTSTSPHLDGAYAAFGKVTEGIETAYEIVNAKRDYNDKPLQDQKIKSIRVETYGKEYPFTKLNRR